MKEKFKHILAILTIIERRQFWIQVILNIFISIADVVALALLLLVINFYISNSADRLDFLPKWMLDPGSVALIAFFFILFGIKNLFGIIISSAQFNFISRVAVRISQNKLANYQQGKFEDFVNIDSSAHISKIAYHPFEFCQHILSGTQQIIIQAVLILFTITAILLYNATLFLFLLLVLVPPVTFVFFYIKKRIAVAKKNILVSNEKSHKYLFDALKGYVEGNIYQRNDFFHQRFSIARQTFSKNLFESLSIQTMPNRIIETFAILGLFILIVIAKWSGIKDNSTLIMIGAFMAAAYKIIPGIVKIINAAGQMKAYDFSIYDLETFNQKAKTEDQFTQAELIYDFQLRNLSFEYKDHAVIKDFSLSIKKGDFVGITGKSGKGKTTILNLLLGFLQPSQGEVLINDRSVSAGEIKNYWPQIAYVRQQSFFIHDSILRNITLTEDNYNKEKLELALNISGLNDFIKQSPDGLNKMITENGKNISGGQQQRIAIARALYKDAGFILLDEPFNELDETSTALLAQHFKEMTVKGKTVIMITHDNKSLSYCSKVISLDDKE
ncbi:MAG TPA: ABC transporter ATP-binding protein [Chitinophagaceae bacterium]|nr:ABC transporter ATP-binding protein [Chitinophagaceae bacterium]